MKRALALIIFALATCSGAAATKEPLRLFVVHEAEAAGLHAVKVDTLNLEGFVAAEPDLIIKAVAMVAAMPPSTSVIIDENGKKSETPPIYQVMITLNAPDGASFAELTGRSVRQRILICLGERPLSAPVVYQRINTPSFQLRLGRDKKEARKLELELLQLMK